MQWTFSTLGCPDAGFDEMLDIAKSNDLRGVEIRTLDNSTDIPGVFRNRFGSPEEAARLRHDFPVPIHALNTSCRLIGNNTESREALLEFIPWAEALNVPHLRVFDGGKTCDFLDTESLCEATDFFAWWRALKQERNLYTDIAIETHDALCTTRTILQLQAALPKPAAILWDSHHTWRKGGESPETTWNSIREWVRHIHFKDSISRPSARHPYTHVLPGTGEMDLNALFQQLKRDTFEGPVSLEWEKYWNPGMPPLEEALLACRAAGWW